MGHTVFKTHGEISHDVADQLAMLTRENYLKMKELSSEIEEVKTSIDQVHERVEYFFLEPSINMVTMNTKHTKNGR
jgi:uncharacterized coiled-coil DUF342 family protein